ncbi:DUF6192 family protein [Streptomyces phaeochromogenes]|uniref:DUF6192 family protein n=1 Tax=Streptomyces phaeochromogenes TaxID=1923 RepID=UPI002E2D06E2|nr:DUF6192 family protein [Streptomyces phaeochromogenes]
MDLDCTNSVAPVVKHPDHALQFLDLFTACHSFAADVDRVVPRLRDRRVPEDQRAVIHSHIARTRAVLDALETAMDTGEIDVGEELALTLPSK